MVAPAAGGIVLVPFPFSDLRGTGSSAKVTSNPYGDPRAILLPQLSFSSGSLRSDSYARPGKLFTASQELVVAQIATLRSEAREQIIDAVVSIPRDRASANA